MELISIREQIKLLEELISNGEIFLEKILKKNSNKEPQIEDVGRRQIKPSDRLQMVKKMNASSINFKTEKNKLKALLVTIENNSAKQAEYLTGINKKYASKAISRSATADISIDQIYNDIVKIANNMTTLNDDINTNNKMNDTSILSLETPLEQCKEWLAIKEKKVDEFDNEYSFLVFAGFIGHPIKFEHNNAVQMDPFQTRCINIEPYLVDSPSIMLANQLNHQAFKSPINNEPITDVLVLVSPTCPIHSLLTMKSLSYKLLCSVTLCRDLQMYNPKMTFSMYSHAFMKAIDLYFTTSSSAYLKLAINILYSAHKLGISSPKLFTHWFEECGTLTQNEEDNCNHPVQLLLLLGLNKVNSNNANIPLVNMLNEALSRIIRIRLVNLDTRKLAQQLCNITANNSPKPDMSDLLKPEPSNEDVRNSCNNIELYNINHSVLKQYNIAEKSIVEFVDNALKPYFRTFQFCLEMHKCTGEMSADLALEIEKNGVDNIAQSIKKQLDPYIKMNLYEYLNINNKIELVATNMFLQASLYTDSSSRVDILDFNVFEGSTFRKMAVDLMMDFYSEGCKIKREEYLKIIGNVTYGQALTASEQQFEMMLGLHTHGLTSQKFRALLKATKGNKAKREIFMNKSNTTVSACFTKKYYLE